MAFALLLGMAGHAQTSGNNDFEGCSIFAPNAFTPNGDGVNDLFAIVLSENCTPLEYHLRMYDRWGRLVFESIDPTRAFDGNYDSQVLKEGVYLWRLVVRFETPDQSRVIMHDERGTVVLIR